MKWFLTLLIIPWVVWGQPADSAVAGMNIGVMQLQTNEGFGEDRAEEITRQLVNQLTVWGYDQVYSSVQLQRELTLLELHLPSSLKDPRTILQVGRVLSLDRMIYGYVDMHKNRIGISLYLKDVSLRATINQVHIEGEAGVDASVLVQSAVARIHGREDSLSTRPFYGPHVNNLNKLIVSGSAVLGAGVVFGVINSSVEHKNSTAVMSQNIEYRDEPLSGITSSVNQIPLFARPAALANAYIALSDDAYGVLYNPAGMALVAGPQASAAYQNRYGFLDVMAASYVNKATRNSGFGQAILYAADRDHALTELFFVSALAYRLNHLYHSLNQLSVGVSVKIAANRVKQMSPDSPAGSSFGAGLDMGLMWELSEKIRYGLLLRDVPVVNKWKNSVTEEEYFEAHAATLHMGGAFQAGYTTLLVAEGQIPLYDDQTWKMAGGIEQQLLRIFALRIGMHREIMRSEPTPWKITGGFGLRIDTESLFGSSMELDCSYEHNSSGVFNVLNISMKVDF